MYRVHSCQDSDIPVFCTIGKDTHKVESNSKFRRTKRNIDVNAGERHDGNVVQQNADLSVFLKNLASSYSHAYSHTYLSHLSVILNHLFE